jgi:predicted ferric reductase
MDDVHRRITPRYYGTNTTYVYEYSRGLDGVNVRRDILITRIIVISVIFVSLAVFCGRIAQISHAYLRHITSLTASRRQQAFWSIEDSVVWANIKEHLLYAPIGRKRHNRELQLSPAINVGTLPSRFQTILILLYVASQVAYITILDYNVNEWKALLAELRGRSGTLALLNMVPLFILAGRNNLLIPLLHISFDTYNCFHRWLGRIIMIESVVHTVAWAINACDESGGSDILERLRTIPSFTWGMIGVAALVFLCIHSFSPIRHAFYETFLHLHQLGAVLAFIGVYLHLDADKLPQIPWALAIATLWILERSARLVRLLYLNVSLREGTTKLSVEVLPGEACRVTFHLPKHVRIAPGSHVYAYIPSVSWWMSHPFSLAWAQPSNAVTAIAGPGKTLKSRFSAESSSASHLEKQSFANLDDYMRDRRQPTSVSLIICARQGMTRKLYNKALKAPGKALSLSGYIEGPYRSHISSMGSYGTVVLFSAGAGITHHMLYVRDLIIRASEGRVATQQIYLIWSIRTIDHLTWVQEWLNQILQLPGRREVLTIKFFVSKPKSGQEVIPPSTNVQMFPGRCLPRPVLDEVIPKRIGATLVSVCGPGAFADDVRAATRNNIGKGVVVDFVEEAFTW